MHRGALAFALGSVFLLAACSKAAPPLPPLNVIKPEEIDYPTIKANNLFGSGCNFVADGGGLAALVLAQEKEAIIKLDGKIVRIPADTGSQILPATARTRYVNADHILILAPIPGGPPAEIGQIQSLPIRLAIVDKAGRQASRSPVSGLDPFQAEPGQDCPIRPLAQDAATTPFPQHQCRCRTGRAISSLLHEARAAALENPTGREPANPSPHIRQPRAGGDDEGWCRRQLSPQSVPAGSRVATMPSALKLMTSSSCWLNTLVSALSSPISGRVLLRRFSCSVCSQRSVSPG